ncbi:(2Fe-2S) ferredoxin domain-containing protein [Kovacikia minuta CCNUW1]|uniref:(2Fe-2S) ferredoxin domain-containing protein n=1 Tax=Kovacikia minuta TaxID=2931930 RepID=UPI001CCDC72B|nr:(2Fe-2S) ferredoxin domain-containing protein [Kovacikia minuta]UBF29251.1 (2Fe-2S) ferredoxin domain-containing protein [Kovacikia minuta CCNUW1]
MSKKDKQVSLFNLEGRFLSFLMEDGYKIKYLRLLTIEGELCIKPSKESRASVGGILTPGDWIQVWGEKTVKPATDEIKLKAYKIRIASPGESSNHLSEKNNSERKATPAKATILVCQKSDCMKRGGKAVCKALEAVLDDRNLSDQVTVRGTGCMKDCKAGPNLVVMPGKTRYSRITPGEIPAIVETHFPQDEQPKAAQLETEKQGQSQKLRVSEIYAPIRERIINRATTVTPFSLTLNPSPMLGEGFSIRLPFLLLWVKGLGNEEG